MMWWFLSRALAQVPESVAWTVGEQAQMSRGDAVYRHWREQGVQHGASAVVVQAPVEVVWFHILDLDAYVEFLPYVTQSVLVGRSIGAEGDLYDAQIDFTTMGITTKYLFSHQVLLDQSFATFTMIPIAASPVAEGRGWWKLTPRDANTTLVEYNVDLDLRWFVPGFVQKKAAGGLPRLVALIRDRAEGKR